MQYSEVLAVAYCEVTWLYSRITVFLLKFDFLSQSRKVLLLETQNIIIYVNNIQCKQHYVLLSISSGSFSSDPPFCEYHHCHSNLAKQSVRKMSHSSGKGSSCRDNSELHHTRVTLKHPNRPGQRGEVCGRGEFTCDEPVS